MGFSTKADGRGDRLAGEHVGSVEFAIDDVVEKLFPVWLGGDFDLKSFVFEVAHFLGDNDWGAIG